MLRNSRTVISILMGFIVVGCRASATTPSITKLPATQAPLPTAMETEPTLISSVASTAIGSASADSGDTNEVLIRAVTNLLKATSFEVLVHGVRAYQVLFSNGETRLVYGEFNTNYAVIRLPTLKVHGSYEYRYDPQDDFLTYDSYSYQENSKYFYRIVETSGTGDAKEIDPEQIEPISSDVYQTLVNYSDQAKLIAESDGIAVYIIKHPEWYRLKGAIGFADLGFLQMQENGEQLIEQYVKEHYLNIKPILFTIYVAVDEYLISKVEIDDRDFMLSIWEEVDRALIEQGEEPQNLTRYEVMDVNGSEYLFRNYNQVQDFEVP